MEIKWCNEVDKSGREKCWKSGPFSLQQLWMQNFYWQILLTVTWYWFWLNCDWIHDDGSIEFDILFASYHKLLQSATIRWQMLLSFFWVHYVRHFPRRKIFDLLGLTKSVHPSTVVMLTVLIMCNAVVRAKIAYIWTISFLDCCSSLRFSCTWSLNWPWSERTPSKLDLGVACRGLEGCFWVLNRGAHGPVILWGDSSGAFSRIIVRLARILMFPGPLLWILLLAPYTSRLLNVVLVRVECSLRRRDVSF